MTAKKGWLPKHPDGDIPKGTLTNMYKQAGWKDGQRYGVTVPDLAGCFLAGDSIDDALESVKEAIELHLEGLLEEGEDIPSIAPISQHQNNPDYAGGVWALVDVDTTAFEGEASFTETIIKTY